MPNYEYKCTQDGSRFEVWQEVGTPAPACPACGAPSKKVFSPPRVHFKGSGFYLTDLRAEQSGGKNAGQASDAGSTSGSTPSSTSAPEAKVETKSDTAPPASNSGPSAAKTD